MKKQVLGFSRTIYKLSGQTKKPKEGFLDPWSSLRPSFLIKKISRDIIGIFSDNYNDPVFNNCFRLKNCLVDTDRLYGRWALVFPARTYLPPPYPHLQLWYLTKHFAPSLKFVPDKEVKLLAKISSLLAARYQNYGVKKKEGSFAFGFNATPFSFVRDKNKRYYAGGQSVRVFHTHFLLLPPKKEMYKFNVKKKDLYLVYPTDFSMELFKLIIGSEEIVKRVFGKIKPKVGERGLEFTYPFSGNLKTDMEELWRFFKHLDDFFCRIQLAIIYAFYQDSSKFIAEVGKFVKAKDVAKERDELSKLILIGKERSMDKIKMFLAEGLQQVAADYQAGFKDSGLKKLADKLTLSENGDVSSFVFGEKKALRPGMGYGCLVTLRKDRFEAMINPLDILGPKGLMESSGYWVKKKIIAHRLPDWLRFIVEKTKASC